MKEPSIFSVSWHSLAMRTSAQMSVWSVERDTWRHLANGSASLDRYPGFYVSIPKDKLLSNWTITRNTGSWPMNGSMKRMRPFAFLSPIGKSIARAYSITIIAIRAPDSFSSHYLLVECSYESLSKQMGSYLVNWTPLWTCGCTPIWKDGKRCCCQSIPSVMRTVEMSLLQILFLLLFALHC